MADQRSVMKEYRALEQKRQAGGLSTQEEARLAQLREHVGPETGVGLGKPGFDVNAAAARLRESLLPAGLRSRPPPMPEASSAPEPEPEPANAADAALAAEWNAAPFAPLAEPDGLSADALFDPGTLGAESPPEETATPYDPNAQPYDPNAAVYDPNAQPYDPNVQPYDPNAQPYDPNAAVYDPNAQPYDPNAAVYDPNAQPYDPNVQPYDPNAAVYDPNATPQWDAAVQPAEDPNLAAPWGDAPSAEAPLTAASGSWDASAFPAEEQSPVEPAWAPDVAAVMDSGLDVEPLAPEPELVPEAELQPELEPALDPEQAPEEFLPFDAAAASAIAPDSVLEGWDAASLLAPLGAGQELTSEDDAFAQGFQLESNGSFGGAGEPAEPTWSAAPPEPEPESWESAPALDLGAMAPAGEVPPIDLAPDDSKPVPVDVPRTEPELPAVAEQPAEPETLEEIDVEEIPIVDDVLEEIPPVAPPTAAALSLRIEGAHRVVVHTVEGLVRRGSITDAALDAPTLPLAPQPGATPEDLATIKVKAIFFMLSPGEKAPSAEGKKVRVTFTDGRQIAGFSPDYSDAGPGFFMIPADTRTNTGRIWVYRAAVKSVAVS